MIDWTKKVCTADGQDITLVLAPDKSRCGCAYGYVGDGCEIHKWHLDGSCLTPFYPNPHVVAAKNKMRRQTLHLNIYRKVDDDGYEEWEVHAHESVGSANEHAGKVWAQTAVTVEVPEE